MSEIKFGSLYVGYSARIEVEIDGVEIKLQFTDDEHRELKNMALSMFQRRQREIGGAVSTAQPAGLITHVEAEYTEVEDPRNDDEIPF